MILIATGSEVQLALGAREELSRRGIGARVVSLPCWELFDRQDQAVPRRGAAAGGHAPGSRSRRPRRSAGTATSATAAKIIGMHTFGTSAPLKDLLTKFGFTPDKVADAAREARRGR